MSQAEVTNALRQKDIEKTLALEEIRNAEIQQSRGFAGKLYVSLIGVRGFDGQSSGANLTYTLAPANYGEAAPADQTKDAGHLLISRDVVLSLCLAVPIESATLSQEPVELEEPAADADQSTNISYYAEFDCKELPEEGYMQLELIGKNEGQLYADLKFVIKVSYDEFDKVILHKKTELEQIQQQMKDMNNSVKDASRAKAGKAKKTKKVVAGEKNAAYSAEGEDLGPSKLDIAMMGAMGAAAFVVDTRSYWLFGVAAMGIFYFGEYASI